MSAKEYLRQLACRGARLFAECAESELRDRRNVDIVLGAALREPGALSHIHDPVGYTEFLRSCIEPARHIVAVKKADSGSPDDAAKRFTTLVDELRRGLPAIEFSLAREIALVADQNRCRSEGKVAVNWAGDVGLHFSVSSSFGSKGRILFNVVRFTRRERCLELGTAYGMSAFFILAALNAYSAGGFLATMEGFEPQFSLSSSMLKERFKESVSCHFGNTRSELPGLVKSLGRIDFLFHDAGHSRDDYTHDFNQVSEILVPGAVVLFDDIRWENPRFTHGEARTYDGWEAIIAHPRVRRAVEIDGTLGLLLMR